MTNALPVLVKKKNLFELGDDQIHRLIEEALRKSKGSVMDAAKSLGVSRVTIWRWRKKRAADAQTGNA